LIILSCNADPVWTLPFSSNFQTRNFCSKWPQTLYNELKLVFNWNFCETGLHKSSLGSGSSSGSGSGPQRSCQDPALNLIVPSAQIRRVSTRRFYKRRADVVFAIYIAVVHAWSFFSDQWRLWC
jgi:hypothetical protein